MRVPGSGAALVGLVALAGAAGPAGAQRWQMQYLHDEEKTTLTLNDLVFPSATRGVAVGFTAEGRKLRPVALVTNDAGANWSLLSVPDTASSLFFLNENLGWMVAGKGIFHTTETGRNWKKLASSPKGALRVYFLDQQHGFAAGLKKSVMETLDGGGHWKAVAAAAEPKTTVDYTVYNWINFVTPTMGVITGWSQTPRKDRDAALPAWIDPDQAMRAETPHLSLSLETRDAGKNWRSAVTSNFGKITRLRFGRRGYSIGLVEYSEAFQVPSEVYRIDATSGQSQSVYKQKDRRITDVWIAPSGTAYLAGVEAPGTLRSAPIPGKVKILRSDDWQNWTEIPVDYRAVAGRVTLSMVDDSHIWVATDTGMILRLTP